MSLLEDKHVEAALAVVMKLKTVLEAMAEPEAAKPKRTSWERFNEDEGLV